MIEINKRRQFFYRLRFYFLFLLPLLAISCGKNENDVFSEIKTSNTEIIIANHDTMPSEVLYGPMVKYSENGHVKFVISGGKALNYTSPNKIIFPQGFEIYFFDENYDTLSYLTGQYGISLESEKIMKAQNDVVFINYKTNEKIETDQLSWDQKAHKIWSNDPVKITTKDDVIYGNAGFQSDENMSYWIINQPNGNFKVDEK